MAEVDPLKIAHEHTNEAPEPCGMCQQPTQWRVIYRPFPLIKLSKAICEKCRGDGEAMARFLGRVASTLKTGTRLGGGSE
jgi:hypothetical protein